MCSGKHQSPINIDSVNVINCTCPDLQFTNFAEYPTISELLNNGHTVVLRSEYGKSSPTIEGGPLDGEYVFEQLHFHWGDNYVSFPAELHIVFRNNKYETFAEAALESNGVAVLAYFYEISEEDNEFYEEFSELLEQIVKPDMSAKFKTPLSLWAFTHSEIGSYYTYTGSLTTPPCSEDVTWIDFKFPISISAKQMDRFRHLYTYDNTPLIHSFRPLQPLNNRTVYSALPQTWDEVEDDINEDASAVPFVDILFGGARMGKVIYIGNIVMMLLSLLLLQEQ